MFMILLKFTDRKPLAGEFMAAHKGWIQQGFEDGVFLLTGSLQTGLGGAVLAHNTQAETLQRRIEDDPFVAEGIVQAEIIEMSPNRADPRMEFLLP